MSKATYSQSVAEEIRALLARRSVTRSRLAGEIGMAESTLSGRLNGRTSFYAYEVAAIASALDIDVREILPAFVSAA